MKQLLTLITLFLVAQSASSETFFHVFFPNNTNHQVSISLNADGFGQRDYHSYLEYPSTYDNGKPTSYTSSGLGHKVVCTIIEEQPTHAICKVAASYRELLSWNYYGESLSLMQQPVFTSTSYEGEFLIPYNQWMPMSGVIRDGTNVTWNFQLEKR